MQSYFKSLGQHQSRFRHDMPGLDWLGGFVKCHKLTKRLTNNVKAARAEILMNTGSFNGLFQQLGEIG